MKSERITNVKPVVEAAIFIALAFITRQLGFQILPQGGHVNVTALPLALYAVRNGVKWGILMGAIYGIVVIMLVGILYHPLSGLLDFIFPSAAMGLAGLFEGNFRAYLGILLGSIVGLASHILSGVIIFGHFMPEVFFGLPMQNVFFYSLLYNAAHVIPSIVLSLVTLSLLHKPLNRFILGKI